MIEPIGLLRLDEIDRGDDEKLNETRKNLINLTHRLSDKLESTVSGQKEEIAESANDNSA